MASQDELKMSSKALNRVIKSSKEAATGQVQHLLVVVLPDGCLRVNGSNDCLNYFKENEELYHAREEPLVSGLAKDRKVNLVGLVDYPQLSCSPFTSEWDNINSSKVQHIMVDMLASTGYSRQFYF